MILCFRKTMRFLLKGIHHPPCMAFTRPPRFDQARKTKNNSKMYCAELTLRAMFARVLHSLREKGQTSLLQKRPTLAIKHRYTHGGANVVNFTHSVRIKLEVDALNHLVECANTKASSGVMLAQNFPPSRSTTRLITFIYKKGCWYRGE